LRRSLLPELGRRGTRKGEKKRRGKKKRERCRETLFQYESNPTVKVRGEGKEHREERGRGKKKKKKGKKRRAGGAIPLRPE